MGEISRVSTDPKSDFFADPSKYLKEWAKRLGPYVQKAPRLSDGCSFFEQYPIPASLDYKDKEGIKRWEYDLTLDGHEGRNIQGGVTDRHVRLTAFHNRGAYILLPSEVPLERVSCGLSQRMKSNIMDMISRFDMEYKLGGDSHKRFTIFFNENDHDQRVESKLPINRPQVSEVLAAFDKVISFMPHALPSSASA